MITGDKSTFAIESSITEAYERPSFRALGYFVLHIGGLCYGVKEADATMLACAFDEVGRMVADRGKIAPPFASEPNAGKLVDAIYQAIHAPDQRIEQLFGIQKREFSDLIYASHCGWHWACDEAFDDGSVIWHFDIGNRVRLIADRSPRENNGYLHNAKTLRDVWLDADKFYNILENWHKAFGAEWLASAKISERDDGAENG